MATKEQNLKRLDELALILGREPDISGSGKPRLMMFVRKHPAR